jgi:hypothetical protein
VSVANQIVEALYDGPGQTTFAIPFQFLANDGPSVVAVAKIDKLTGARTKLTLSTDYTLPAAVGLDPVNVVLVNALPTGIFLHVYRQTPITQTASYQDTGIFPAKTHERALDRLTLITQELAARVKRSFMISSAEIGKVDPVLGLGADGMLLLRTATGVRWATAAEIAALAAGAASGKLKAPTDGTYGGSGGNPAGVAVGDIYEDAFDKVASLLSKLTPTPPAGLAGRALTVPGAYAAKEAGTGANHTVIDTAAPVITPGLTSNIANGFTDPDSGTLSAFLDGAPAGVVNLTAGDDSGLSNGSLTVVAEFDPYLGAGFGKEGIFKAITAKIQAAALAVGLHSAQLKHSVTGDSVLTGFYVDQPATPTAAGNSMTFTGATTYRSGVPGAAPGESIGVAFTIASAVAQHYNPTRIANVSATVANAVDYQPSVSPAANSNVVGSVALAVLSGKYTENVVATILGYNQKGTASAAATISNNVRVDTVGDESARQRCGVGQYPSSGYGSTFSSVASILSSEELQYLNGVFRFPPAVDYSGRLPAGPNYSTITGGTYSSMRWALFNLGAQTNISAIIFMISNAFGFGTSAIVSGIALQVRVDGASGTTGWVDANAAYPGVGSPTANGDAALDVGSSTATTKRVTFGTAPKTGTVYVRIGIPQGSTMTFGGIA